jgi:hypothetical protein
MASRFIRAGEGETLAARALILAWMAPSPWALGDAADYAKIAGFAVLKPAVPGLPLLP